MTSGEERKREALILIDIHDKTGKERRGKRREKDIFFQQLSPKFYFFAGVLCAFTCTIQKTHSNQPDSS